MKKDQALVFLGQAERLLQKYKTIPELKGLRDKAEAVRQYAKSSGLGLEIQNHAAEVGIRAERKGGALLKAMAERGERHTQGRPKTLHDGRFKLEDLGLTEIESHRWQLLATLTDDELSALIKKLAEKIAELTRRLIVREIRRKAIEDKLATIKRQRMYAADGTFDVIIVDPPWPIEKIALDERPTEKEIMEYPIMSIEEIKAFSSKIRPYKDCHLWLWTTNRFLPTAFEVLNEWEFKYVCTFVWHKPGGMQPFGLPSFNCEFALYARKGSPRFQTTKDFDLCFSAPRMKHSEKPNEFYDMVRRVTYGRRIDMFNRRKIQGFDGWGKESEN